MIKQQIQDMSLDLEQNRTLVEIHLQSNIGTTQNKENTRVSMTQCKLYQSKEHLK